MQQDPNTSPADSEAVSSAPSADLLARRRALFQGLTKGGAAVMLSAPLLARAVPARVPTNTDTVPNYQTTQGNLCTVSGQQSAVMSRGTGNAAVCGALPPSSFVDTTKSPAVKKNWPSGFDETSSNLTALYSSSGDNRLLLALLAASSTSSESVWIAAYFNALLNKTTTGLNFPYNTDDVRSLYLNDRANAETFLRKVMGLVPW